jgi:hypothetical protein
MDKLSIAKLKEFWLKYEQKIVLVVAFFLVSAISFQFGALQGQKWQQKPLIIEKPTNIPTEQANAQNGPHATPQPASNALIGAAAAAIPASANPAVSTPCAFVGSKNSNKFYLPSCSYAKRVKPENLVCFKTAEEATAQGRSESVCK